MNLSQADESARKRALRYFPNWLNCTQCNKKLSIGQMIGIVKKLRSDKYKGYQFCSISCDGKHRTAVRGLTTKQIEANENRRCKTKFCSCGNEIERRENYSKIKYCTSCIANGVIQRKSSERMRANNPMSNPDTLARMTSTLIEKYKDLDPFEFTRGGNGRGLTRHEELLSAALEVHGIPHENQKAISLGKRTEGYPTCYKPDIVIGYLCIEIDGTSHSSHKAKQRDIKKETKLCELGYKTIRFTNKEVEDTESCVQIIKSMI